MKLFKLSASALATATALTMAQSALAQDLKIQSFLAKPEHFGVTSTLIEGDKEVLLVNAQFSKSEALRIAANILDSGKTLKTIFVSYGDPDYYFGLDVFKQYFPNVQIIATPETVKHIQDTQALKVKYWGPQMGANAPSQIIVPQAYTAKTLKLENESIEIKGKRAYLFMGSFCKSSRGGIPVSSGIHLWMADTPKTKDRVEVIQSLESIKALQPKIVVPAHMVEGAPQGLDAVNFSISYLNSYEKAAKATKNATELSKLMQKQYPTLQSVDSLELGAKVVKGEMQWP